MGKRRQSEDSTKATKHAEVEETKAVDDERYESDLVRLKKENAKAMERSISNMNAQVKQSIEQKQIIAAVKALQKHFADKQDKASKAVKKNLLQDEDANVHLSFTLGQVPTKPTPRPL